VIIKETTHSGGGRYQTEIRKNGHVIIMGTVTAKLHICTIEWKLRPNEYEANCYNVRDHLDYFFLD